MFNKLLQAHKKKIEKKTVSAVVYNFLNEGSLISTNKQQHLF